MDGFNGTDGPVRHNARPHCFPRRIFRIGDSSNMVALPQIGHVVKERHLLERPPQRRVRSAQRILHHGARNTQRPRAREIRPLAPCHLVRIGRNQLRHRQHARPVIGVRNRRKTPHGDVRHAIARCDFVRFEIEAVAIGIPGMGRRLVHIAETGVEEIGRRCDNLPFLQLKLRTDAWYAVGE